MDDSKIYKMTTSDKYNLRLGYLFKFLHHFLNTKVFIAVGDFLLHLC